MSVRKKRTAPKVTGKEIWAAPEPTDLMAWSVCPYLLKDFPLGKCKRCPKWERDKHYGKLKRGCRMTAEEVCRIVHAAKALTLDPPKRKPRSKA